MKEICDFCLDPNPVRYYNHPTIIPPMLPITFEEGQWAACQECAGLHESGDVANLLKRALEALGNKSQMTGDPLWDGITREALRYTYERLPREGFDISCTGD
jgi:hypothetical protein